MGQSGYPGQFNKEEQTFFNPAYLALAVEEFRDTKPEWTLEERRFFARKKYRRAVRLRKAHYNAKLKASTIPSLLTPPESPASNHRTVDITKSSADTHSATTDEHVDEEYVAAEQEMHDITNEYVEQNKKLWKELTKQNRQVNKAIANLRTDLEDEEQANKSNRVRATARAKGKRVAFAEANEKVAKIASAAAAVIGGPMAEDVLMSEAGGDGSSDLDADGEIDEDYGMMQ